MEAGFAEIEHTADAALLVWGADLPELFVNAARGLAWLQADPASVTPTVAVPVDLAADDVETLLVAWLGELLYLGERDGVVFTAFDLVEVSPTHLRGTAYGGPPGEQRRPVKAVTFNRLAVRPGPRGLETPLVFDV